MGRVETKVIQEVRDLMSYYKPEGWLEMDTKMEYHTNELKWGGEGAPEGEMEKITQSRSSKIPANADCIAYLYNYVEMENPKIPDHIYYRRCKTKNRRGDLSKAIIPP